MVFQPPGHATDSGSGSSGSSGSSGGSGSDTGGFGDLGGIDNPTGIGNPGNRSGGTGNSAPTASGPVGTDDSDWPGLRTAAQEGQLQFDPSVAVACYKACSTMIGNIESLMNTIAATTPSPSAPLFTSIINYDTDAVPSPSNFRTLLTGKWTDLYNHLYQHKLILTDMGETFVSAANAYKGAEVVSADSFTTLDPGSTSTIHPTLSLPSPPDWSSTYASGSSSGSYSLGGSGSSANLVGADNYATTIADTAEDGTSFNLANFYCIGQSITTNSNNLADAAAQWNAVQIAWNNWAIDYHQAMQNALNSGAWTGNAATAAINAVTNYTSGAVPALGQTMGAMYQTLLELASLLNYLSGLMPTSGEFTEAGGTITGMTITNGNGSYETGSGCNPADNDVSTIQQAWSQAYPPGLRQIAAITPAFSDPGTTTTSGPAASGNSGSGNNGNGNNGSSGPPVPKTPELRVAPAWQRWWWWQQQRR